ncbi:MAG: tRNA 2-thiouridine(34) synthase MnmA [Actinomycetota bacterium]|nr:tRNA 2-thiouridine(34) synthase MnmA [Actinomycetota bacterium]
MNLIAAMSGGVDSAVAAALMVDAGHAVTGIHLALASTPDASRTGSRGCCTVEDANDARRVADVLGIPFYIWDLAERFRAEVIDDFLAEYAAGRTPNPCVRCNEQIKFASVLDRALALGFDGVVTGHHARLEDGVLRRSVDVGKDQSYVLATLTERQLGLAVFPLGEMTKDEVRREAARRGLLVADKPDSHDICFIADGDTRGFLGAHLGTRPGDVVDDETGAVVGQHGGAHGFTVGQRRGLGLGVPASDGKPRYVLSLSVADNTVRVGPGKALEIGSIRTGPPVWHTGVTLGVSIECIVQLRAHGMTSPARVTPHEYGADVELHRRQRGIAAGQTAVFYGGPSADVVLGAARIESADRVLTDVLPG